MHGVQTCIFSAQIRSGSSQGARGEATFAGAVRLCGDAADPAQAFRAARAAARVPVPQQAQMALRPGLARAADRRGSGRRHLDRRAARARRGLRGRLREIQRGPARRVDGAALHTGDDQEGQGRRGDRGGDPQGSGGGDIANFIDQGISWQAYEHF